MNCIWEKTSNISDITDTQTYHIAIDTYNLLESHHDILNLGSAKPMTRHIYDVIQPARYPIVPGTSALTTITREVVSWNARA